MFQLFHLSEHWLTSTQWSVYVLSFRYVIVTIVYRIYILHPLLLRKRFVVPWVVTHIALEWMLYVKHMAFKKHVFNMSSGTGPLPWRHLTLDKTAGTAPHALKWYTAGTALCENSLSVSAVIGLTVLLTRHTGVVHSAAYMFLYKQQDKSTKRGTLVHRTSWDD